MELKLVSEEDCLDDLFAGEYGGWPICSTCAAERELICGAVAVTAGSGSQDSFTCVAPLGHDGDHDFAGADR